MSEPALESTLDLIRHYQSGNEEALEQLCSRYLTRLRYWARGRLPSWARGVMDTGDVVQDTLIKVLRQIDRFDVELTHGFHAYVRRALDNRLRDEIRRIQRRPPPADELGDHEDSAPSAVERAIGRENLRRYETALERVTPGQREAIVGRLELGMSYRELAEALGKPSEDAARMTVQRGLRRLAEAMVDA